MTLQELKDALATYGANPQERGLEVFVATDNDEPRPITAIEIETMIDYGARVTLS